MVNTGIWSRVSKYRIIIHGCQWFQTEITQGELKERTLFFRAVIVLRCKTLIEISTAPLPLPDGPEFQKRPNEGHHKATKTRGSQSETKYHFRFQTLFYGFDRSGVGWEEAFEHSSWKSSLNLPA